MRTAARLVLIAALLSLHGAWSQSGSKTLRVTFQAAETGFDPVRITGANLFWRWLQIPALLTGGRLRGLLEWAIYLDGEVFTSANIFVAARKVQ